MTKQQEKALAHLTVAVEHFQDAADKMRDAKEEMDAAMAECARVNVIGVVRKAAA
jgi:hypothetical protein